MIVHRQTVIKTADMAATLAQSQEVTDLAQRIGAAVGPEIDQMTDWLDTWGELVGGGSISW